MWNIFKLKLEKCSFVSVFNFYDASPYFLSVETSKLWWTSCDASRLWGFLNWMITLVLVQSKLNYNWQKNLQKLELKLIFRRKISKCECNLGWDTFAKKFQIFKSINYSQSARGCYVNNNKRQKNLQDWLQISPGW